MPYSNLPPSAFWKLCRDDPEFRASEMWQPKFRVAPGDKVATAGSCFAQNISRYLGRSSLTMLQAEPAPRGMDDAVARRFGYGLYSARYGNIYTARQLRQLVEDALAERLHDAAVWQREGRYFDALRPGVEPEGLDSVGEVMAHRKDHLRRVGEMIGAMDVLIFTLGLTETWEDTATGLVFPSAPGVIVGAYDPDRHQFRNQGFGEVMADLQAAIALLRKTRPGLRVVLTVSPVPLTATASGGHVLAATTYSKSVLRAVAGELAAADEGVDYFPAYELVAGQPFAGESYADNLRSVSDAAVERVMRVFFAAQGAELAEVPDVPRETPRARRRARREAEICEDILLEAFAPK